MRKSKKRKPGPVKGSKRTNRNERLSDRLIDGTVAGLRAKAAPLELYEYLAALAGNPHACCSLCLKPFTGTSEPL